MIERHKKQNGEEVDMTEVTAKFIFKLPFSIKIKREHGSNPQYIKTNSEEIVVYPPAKYEYSLFEEPLWSPDPKQFIGKINGEPVWNANCIPIHIRRDFSTIPITDEDQKALVAVARDILYKLLTMYRWRGGQLQVNATNIEKLDYDLRYFDSANKRINAGPGGATGTSRISISTMPPKIIEWNDICQDLISGNMPELHESLLLDARSIVSQEPRRAVLDAATACEIYIKRFYKSREKRESTLDSLKKNKPELLKEIERLKDANRFVKHEGLCQYKNDKGKVIPVDSTRARDFINAVEEAIEYTRSLEGK
jgi:hypothetical protein